VVAGQRNVLQPDIDLTGFSFLDGPRNYSPIVSVMRITPRNGVNVRWQADYDPRFHRFTSSMFSTDFRIRHYFASLASNVSRPNSEIAPPLVQPRANQLIAQGGYGDPNRKGWNMAVSTVYDFRLGYQLFAIAQITYNTDCCGLSFEYRRNDYGTLNDTQYRVAFSIANIGTFGNLKKQERIF
jgi:LPS-assembly protein